MSNTSSPAEQASPIQQTSSNGSSAKLEIEALHQSLENITLDQTLPNNQGSEAEVAKPQTTFDDEIFDVNLFGHLCCFFTIPVLREMLGLSHSKDNLQVCTTD